MLRRTTIAALLLASSASAADWGSFDASRINYANGVFTTGLYSHLRGKVLSNGDNIAPATDLLTPQYLETVDVFFTSFLSLSTGTLSAAEQDALVEWVRCGGRLIVTAEYQSIAQNNSFLKPFEIETATGTSSGCATPTISHPLTAGVNQTCFFGEAELKLGTGVLPLMKTSSNKFFMAVASGTPAVGGGRVLAIGDHTPLTDTASADDALLRSNIVKWAAIASPPPCPSTSASWSNYGAGFPGTNGVPSLVLDKNPKLDSTISMKLTNSGTTDAPGLLAFGTQAIALPSAFGGDLLVAPQIVLQLTVPAGGLILDIDIPCNPALCGLNIYGQGLMKDSGAAKQVSFSAGLSMILGS